MWGISCKYSLRRRFFGVIPLRMTHAFLAFRIRQRRSRSPIKRGADFRTSLAFYGFSSSVIPDFVIPSEGASPTRNLILCHSEWTWGIPSHAHTSLRSVQNDSRVIPSKCEGSPTILTYWQGILPPFGRQNDSACYNFPPMTKASKGCIGFDTALAL